VYDYFFAGNQYIRVTRDDTGPGVVDTGYGAIASAGSIGLEDSIFSGNGTAIQAQPGGQVNISNVDMFDNAAGIGTGGG
jgi:hypothetical protein